MTIQLANSTNEPIPGYKVQERIGAGGYGEVWTVEAPGGLAKAIKFVYGYLDEERASRELKALNRIKSVRHPFLISLERIEVVEGQLVIITELAEGSLKHRFDQCQREGLPGIPRDELLRYVRDAADALDYMSESYSLQHLDIKPENLLRVGRHVKVADFGLVKELHEVTGSLMGGLTPLYAPPESFDGRPSRFSDQYSLAIVYQEMLTGVLPFPGTTAAQLAAQHLHSKPRVTSLPPAEQQVVLKALSKNPAERFSSCSEMVEQLERAARGASELLTVKTDQLSNEARARISATSQLDNIDQLVDELNSQQAAEDLAATEAATAPSRPRAYPDAARNCNWHIPPVDEHCELESLAPLPIDESEFRLRPTLFVGIGGTAGRVIARLSHRLHDRFDGRTIPVVRSLLLETDGNAATQLAHAAKGNFDSQQVMVLPLRRPKDYRNTARGLLQSISRRWIYNIPRSQQTEGIRPLGRLAFLDHAAKVQKRLRDEIAAMVQSDAVDEAQQLLQSSVDSAAPRIYIVSSTSGGTGGGMLTDVAHSVKQTLKQMGLPDKEVYALLCHWTPRNQAAKDLAIANSYACLSELQQYSRTDRQIPGDIAAGLKPLPADHTLFKEVGIVHLGEELGPRELEARTRRAAEYLYLDTVTPCAALSAKRKDAGGSCSERQPWDVRVKTVGVFQIGSVLEEAVDEAARDLCGRVIQRWRGKPDTENNRMSKVQTVCAADPASETDGSSLYGEATRLAAEQVGNLRLDQETLTALAEKALETVLEDNSQACFQKLRAQTTAGNAPQATIQAIEVFFGPLANEPNQEDKLDESLRQQLQRHLTDHTNAVGDNLSSWILQILDSPATGLGGAEQAAEWIKAYLRDLQEKLRESEQHMFHELMSLPQVAPAADAKPKSRVRATKNTEPGTDPAWRYFQLRWQRIVANQAKKLARSIGVYAGGAADQLRDVGRELCSFHQQFSTCQSKTNAEAAAQSNDELSCVRERFRDRLRPNLGSLTSELDRSFRSEYFASLGGMRSLVSGDAEMRNVTPRALFAAARRIVRTAQQQIDVSELLLPQEVNSRETGEILRRVVEYAEPHLSDCGGSRRLAITLPRQADRQRLDSLLAEHSQQQASFVTDSDITLLTMIDDIRLSQVAVRLIENRPDYAEAASRLYTRCDVTWKPWDGVQP